MVNKSLRTISDGVRFSYSASLKVRVVPLGVLITYKYVRCRHWFHFQSTVDLMVQNYRANSHGVVINFFRP